jgi:hypothetical protein
MIFPSFGLSQNLYVGPMCDLEVFASLGHPRICFDCIHTTSITEILLPPLPPPHPLVYLKYGIGYSRLYVVFVMSSLLCAMCNAAHNSSMWTYFYFLFPCPMSTSGFEFICKVTSCVKGHFSVILSEGAIVFRKGCSLSPTLDRSKVWLGKKNGCDE